MPIARGFVKRHKHPLTKGLQAMQAVVKRAADLRGHRIAPGDSNHFACLLDPILDGARFTFVVEIFAAGGATPPNTHRAAQVAFFDLRGKGRARAGYAWMPIHAGTAMALDAEDLAVLCGS